ncbi:glycoside hydrolase family 88/105 protein [Edaphobacter flagellatus]|uniref:glycoside hydrolase family 88/105 protein n=1 Tax=Edaphobacter flagellatus TaxID=1933044 RepID=UPI0021B1C36C|nr:glycoside hydrolase family 88 protein [Edaphobacter flagellatus]
MMTNKMINQGCVLPTILVALLLNFVGSANAQAVPRALNGDTPVEAGELAKGLSPDLKSDQVAAAMRLVGDWQLARSKDRFTQDWTDAALYRGYLAAAESLKNTEYDDALIRVGKQFHWKLGSRQTEADDQAIGYIYLKLYRRLHDREMLAAVEAQFDELMKEPAVCTESCHDGPLPDRVGPDGREEPKPLWWWCDALFMAPPVWAELANVTGKREYLDYLDRNWWVTSKLLYDPKNRLFTRDATFLDKREPNGEKVFWSRGNGWVLSGLTLVLDNMPRKYPTRRRYVEQFQAMASRIREIQGSDGLWRPGLLDADAYPLAEVSGSAFYVYAMAWGINHGLLERQIYLPAVRRGWAGLVGHIYADGRLGSIQPIGSSPGGYKPQSSYVFGVGAFLMAGAEIRTLLDRDQRPHHDQKGNKR